MHTHPYTHSMFVCIASINYPWLLIYERIEIPVLFKESAGLVFILHGLHEIHHRTACHGLEQTRSRSSLEEVGVSSQLDGAETGQRQRAAPLGSQSRSRRRKEFQQRGCVFGRSRGAVARLVKENGREEKERFARWGLHRSGPMAFCCNNL
jgi:hypothetical protein